MHWSTILRQHKKLRVFLFVFLLSTLTVTVEGTDPTIIDETNNSASTNFGFQRKIGYVNARFWVSYADGNKLIISTSQDGENWSTSYEHNIGTQLDGNSFSTWFNSTHLAYTVITSGNYLRFRLGEPLTNGTIDWADTVQLVTDDFTSTPSIVLDSAGFVYIGYANWSQGAAKQYPYVIKNEWKNGSWQTASGFPFQLNSTYRASYVVSVIPLTSEKIYVLYRDALPTPTLIGRLYNGSWQTSEIIAHNVSLFSATSIGDNIYVAYLVKNNRLRFRERDYNNGWQSAIDIEASYGGYPVLSRNENNLFLAWSYVDKIYYKHRISGVWSAKKLWFTDSAIIGTSLTSCFEQRENKLAIVYTSGTSSPYAVKFQQYPELSVSFSASQYKAKTNDQVIIEWIIIRLNGSTVNNFQINVTKNGLQWLNNYPSQSAVDSNENNLIRYTCNGVNDLDTNLSVFESDFVDVNWQALQRRGGRQLPPIDEEVAEEIKVAEPFSQKIAVLGLYGLFGALGIVVVGGIVASFSRTKLRRKPRGVRRNGGRQPRGSKKMRSRRPRGVERDKKGRFKRRWG